MEGFYDRDANQKVAPGHGFFGAGHVYWEGDEDGDPKVVYVPLPVPTQDASGHWTQGEFPDAPAELRAPNYRRARKGAYGGGVYSTPEPRAVYASDGESVITKGWLPNNRWAENDENGKVVIFKREFAAGEPGGGDEMNEMLTANMKWAKSVLGTK